MSKSLGNYIGIHEPAADMFGKLMSISDELMWRYFELLSARTLMDIQKLRKSVEEGRNPRDAKFELAMEIVDTYHGRGTGTAERDKIHRALPRRGLAGGDPGEDPARVRAPA